MRLWPLALACMLASGCSCATDHEPSDAATTDASLCANLDGMIESLGPPLMHRAVATTCPTDRAAESATPACDASDPMCASEQCRSDADCTAGRNGRCGRFIAGLLVCTYDECGSDADCTGGPCDCRESSTSAAANTCYGAGNCTLDSDCGQNGYCSPSLVGTWPCSCPAADLCTDAGNGTGCFVSYDGGPPMAVGCLCGNVCAAPGFYCHTPCDTCTNDSDCTMGRCLFDGRQQIWACTIAICS